MSDRARRLLGRAANNVVLFVIILGILFWLYAAYSIAHFFLTFP